MVRALNDAGIVWIEGIPKAGGEGEELSREDMAQWIELSTTTGITLANLFKDLTGFYPLPKEEQV